MERLRRKLSLLWTGDLPDEAYIMCQFDKLRLVGIYPGCSKAPSWHRLGFYAIELFCVLQILAIAWDLLDTSDDIERFGDDLCVLTASLVVLLKRWYCRYYISDLFEFVAQYRVGFELYRHREQQFVQQLHSYHRLESLFVNIAHILTRVLAASLILYGLLYDGFILRAKYPFSTDPVMVHAAVFLIQLMYICHGLFSVVVVEMFCAQLISQLAMHFQLLSMEFPSIGTEVSVNGPQHNEEAVTSRIKQLIMRHQYLLELGNQVQNLLEPTLMGQFVISIILICISAFDVLLAKSNVMLVIRFGTFVLCAFFQIFFWSLFGDLVAQKSLSICDGIANCNWIVLNNRQKKDLSFIMMRAQTPFIINVYRMFPLTFETFLAIVSRAYSIFTVLMEMIE